MRTRPAHAAAAAAALAVLLAAGCGSGEHTGGDGHPTSSVGPSYRGGIPNDDYTQGEETPPPPAPPLKVGQPATLGPLKVTLERFERATGDAATTGDGPDDWPRLLVVFTVTNPTSSTADPGETGMTVSAGPDGIEGSYTFYDGPGGIGGIEVLGDTPIRPGARRLVRWVITVPARTDIQVVLTGDDGQEVTWLGDAPAD